MSAGAGSGFGLAARKTARRFQLGMADSASPPGAGDEGRPCRTVLDSAWLLHRSSHPHPSPLPQGDLCVTRSWLRGRPLTGFRRGRRNLPLPLERVKTGDPLNRLTSNTVAFPQVRVRATADSRCKSVVQRSPEGEGERAAPLSRSRRSSATVSGEGDDTLRLRSRGGVLQGSLERVTSGGAFADGPGTSVSGLPGRCRV